MIKALVKFGFAGGLLGGTISVSDPSLFEFNKEENKRKAIKPSTERIESLDDIKAFTKERGCDFVFVSSWKSLAVYGPQEYVEAETKNLTTQKEEKKKEWTEKLITTAKGNKSKCKKGATLTFFYNKGNGKFGVDKPPAS